MAMLLAVSRTIDSVTVFIGRAVSWLVLAAVLVSAGNAIIRKAFDMSSNAWLELQWYLFGAVFMLAAAYTLQRNEHIRIDIISGRLTKRTRDWIDLLGHVLVLLPFVGLMLWLLIPYVRLSVRIGEHSPNAGGLLLWPAKALLLAGFVLLLFQAVSEIIKRIAVLSGAIEDPVPDPHAHAELDEMLTNAPGVDPTRETSRLA
ncbi:TRAP transporter small permease subunit [Propylenella binzhouense]|uniref:TRAP transporter small permease protein n=1 Tax=Propylenella binzhouense TaxID=2555902 RepID=A0A964T9Q9_9HYPH|nr:TRAP transporter small permease subunit [Propylenella binzhouense]MYZ50492.1 TRAP transporter small permease subunit [Propylenella binzhouense]